jgi:hypothetical protein
MFPSQPAGKSCRRRIGWPASTVNRRRLGG